MTHIDCLAFLEDRILESISLGKIRLLASSGRRWPHLSNLCFCSHVKVSSFWFPKALSIEYLWLHNDYIRTYYDYTVTWVTQDNSISRSSTDYPPSPFCDVREQSLVLRVRSWIVLEGCLQLAARLKDQKRPSLLAQLLCSVPDRF